MLKLSWCEAMTREIYICKKYIFCLLQGQLVYTSVQDPSEEVKQGYNDKSGVGVWGKAGKTMVTLSFVEV